MGTTPNRGYPYPEAATDPPDVPADIEALATPLDVDVQQLLTDVADLQLRVTALETEPQIGQVVYHGRRITAQSIANVANLDIATAIEWDSTVLDPLPGGSRDDVPNSNRIRPPVAGWYRFEGKGAIHASSSPGDTNRARDCGFRKFTGDTATKTVVDGSVGRDLVVATGAPDYPAGTNAISQTPFANVTVVAMNGTTDWVEMFIQQASGAALNTVTDGDYVPTVTVTYVGPL